MNSVERLRNLSLRLRTTTRITIGKWTLRPTHSYPRRQIEASGQLHSWEQSPRYQLDRRLCEPYSRSGGGLEDIKRKHSVVLNKRYLSISCSLQFTFVNKYWNRTPFQRQTACMYERMHSYMYMHISSALFIAYSRLNLEPSNGRANGSETGKSPIWKWKEKNDYLLRILNVLLLRMCFSKTVN
jgi:hypothetical protein